MVLVLWTVHLWNSFSSVSGVAAVLPILFTTTQVRAFHLKTYFDLWLWLYTQLALSSTLKKFPRSLLFIALWAALSQASFWVCFVQLYRFSYFFPPYFRIRALLLMNRVQGFIQVGVFLDYSMFYLFYHDDFCYPCLTYTMADINIWIAFWFLSSVY